MNHIDRRRYEMFVRVRDFGGKYEQLFPKASIAAGALSVITAAVGDIEQHDVAETTAAASAQVRLKLDARRALTRRLLKVARTARVVTGDDARLSVHFDSHSWVTDQGLITSARRALEQAAPVAAEFEAHGMSPTFLGELQEALQRFVEALHERGTSRGELIAAQTGIKTAVETALKAIRQLDVIVPNQCGADPVALEVWRRARKIRYHTSPRREAEEPVAAPDTTTPAAAPAPAIVPGPPRVM